MINIVQGIALILAGALAAWIALRLRCKAAIDAAVIEAVANCEGENKNLQSDMAALRQTLALTQTHNAGMAKEIATLTRELAQKNAPQRDSERNRQTRVLSPEDVLKTRID